MKAKHFNLGNWWLFIYNPLKYNNWTSSQSISSTTKRVYTQIGFISIVYNGE